MNPYIDQERAIWHVVDECIDKDNYEELINYFEELKKNGSTYEQLRAHFYLGCFYCFEGTFRGVTVSTKYQDKFYDHEKAIAELEMAYQMNIQLNNVKDDGEYLVPLSRAYIYQAMVNPIFKDYDPLDYFIKGKSYFERINLENTRNSGPHSTYYAYLYTLVDIAEIYDYHSERCVSGISKNNNLAIKYYEAAILISKKYNLCLSIPRIEQFISALK